MGKQALRDQKKNICEQIEVLLSKISVLETSGVCQIVDELDEVLAQLIDKNASPVIAQDVTERKKTDSELRILSKVFTDGTVPTIIEDLDGNVITVNDETVAAYGWSRQELIGQPIKRLVPPDRHAQADDFLRRCREGEIVRNVEGVRQSKDGVPIAVLLTLSLLTDENDNPVGVATIAHDITERKKTESELRRLSKVFTDGTVPTIIEDLDGNMVTVNDETVVAYGWSRQELIGQPLKRLVPPKRHAQADELLRRCRDGEIVRNVEGIRQTKDGIHVPVLLTLSLLTDENDNPLGIATIAQDITERKKTREMETLLRAVSHDLRSPLVNIDGFSSELAADCQYLSEKLKDVTADEKTMRIIQTLITESIPESLKFIRTGINKMDSLLKGLSYLAKIGTVKLEIQPLDINDLANQVVNVMKFSARKANATIELENLPDCLGDQVQINQVFSNLLGNAIKYLDPARIGQIRMWGKVGDDMSLYCVEDNGVGIPAEHKPKIFEIFHRVDPNSPVSGDGLGLTTTKQIVERHKGRIWVESKEGEGSKFFVSLPRV